MNENEPIPQVRVNLGCLWSLAIGWGLLSLVWSFISNSYSYSPWLDVFAVGSMVVIALYSSYDRWRFGESSLTVAEYPTPGRAFRGTVQTRFQKPPASHIRARVRATHYVRRPGRTTVWSIWVDAQPMLGEEGVLIAVEAPIPDELKNDPRKLDWDLTIQAVVAFGLYRPLFPIRQTPLA